MNNVGSDLANLNELTRIMADLSLTSPTEGNKVQIPVIKHLPELDSITDETLLQVFLGKP